MIATIRSTSARSSGPNPATGEALLLSTGSPNLTTCASAASRRSSSSASSSRSLGSRPVGVVGRLRSSRIMERSATESPASLGVDVDPERDVAQGRGRRRARSTAVSDRGDRALAVAAP